MNWTPLHAAARNNNVEAVQFLLERMALIESRDDVSCILNDTHIITT